MNREASLYIHIPFCVSKCAYCDFFSKPYNSVPDSYVRSLCNEIAFRSDEFKIKKINTIYIGGGTPSLLTPAQFKTLFSKIRETVQLSPDAEISVEINPDDVCEALLEALEECGVTRLSCGIQSLCEKSLKKACRRADARINKKAMELIGRLWKGEVSYDLISGLPFETEDSLIEGLTEICSHKPDHISLYSLTLEENTPFGKQLEKGELKYDFDFADKLWLCGRDFLEAQGYNWYEVSNFCLDEKECRHNLVYWNHKNYLGCGSGACGTVYENDGTGFRWTNSTDINEYCKCWLSAREAESNSAVPPQTSEIIDLQTSQFEFFMMGLRKLSGVSEEEYKAYFGTTFPGHFIYLFDKWQERGLCVKNENGRYAMSREGMLYLNRFLEELF